MMMFGWIILGGIVYFAYIKTIKKVPNEHSALELLDYRYANGQMDEETYLRMKNNIEDSDEW